MIYGNRYYIQSAQRFPEAPRLTAQQIEALDLFDALANDPANYLDIEFKPGDIQLIHNHVILHDRTDYEDWPESRAQAPPAAPLALPAEWPPAAAGLRRPLRQHRDRQPRRHHGARRCDERAARGLLNGVTGIPYR